MVHHYVPTIHPFHRHFVNFPAPRRCHTCSESGHITAFGCSRPPCHPSWSTFSPQASPSGLIYPMLGVPSMCPPPPITLQQYSTLHPHPHTRSEPRCPATFGHAHPSMFPIAWRNFHHKPALVASFILWLEYLLCAHHTHFPIFQLPGTHVDPLFCQPGPFTACTPPHAPFCAPLHTSAHLRAPLRTFTHPCTPLCFTLPGLVTLIRLSSDLGPPSGYHGQPSPSATGHSAHSRPLYNQVQPLWPPCGPSAFPVGLHNPHSHSRILPGRVTSCQSSTHFSLQ